VNSRCAPQLALLTACLLALAGCTTDQPEVPPVAETAEPDPGSISESPSSQSKPQVIGTVASGLAAPWGVDFLPDGTAVVTERDTTRVLSIGDTGRVQTIGRLDQAAPRGEGGLLGVAVSPNFAQDRQLFFYFTTATDNRIVRASYDDTRLGQPEVILAGIPNGFIHDGGRMEFGPDGFLYVSTGETGDGTLAQDRDSLGGKVLRITTEGDPAPGNPDPTSPIWSWGHRNIQGLAFDDRDRLWASEFGQNEWDELNLVEAGQNYGWSMIEGEGPTSAGGVRGLVNPQVVWRTDDASPSGLAYRDDTLWLAALKGERLWRIDVSGAKARQPKGFFVGEFGRLRTVVTAPDGNLWVTTSNRDGRGDPSAKDDRILVIRP
jgi:glucose/arabinose dehydrogenase